MFGPYDVVTAGWSSSPDDFPVTPGAYDTTYNGGPRDVFVLRLDLCPPDLDDDGEIDVNALLLVLAAWGTPDGDVHGDGFLAAAATVDQVRPGPVGYDQLLPCSENRSYLIGLNPRTVTSSKNGSSAGL